MMTKEEIVARLQQSVAVKQLIMQDEMLLKRIGSVIDLFVASLQQGGKIMFCGNGGSAADAQHLAAELSGRFYLNRPPLNAEALHCNSSYLTAVANDFGYDYIFARLLTACGRRGDVVVGLSTSGNSANIIRAFEAARNLGVHTVGFTGSAGGAMCEKSDILLNAPSSDTPRIQEAHITMGHIICEGVETALFG